MHFTEDMQQWADRVAEAYVATQNIPADTPNKTRSFADRKLLGIPNDQQLEANAAYQKARDALWDAAESANTDRFTIEPDAGDAMFKTYYGRRAAAHAVIRGELDSFVRSRANGHAQPADGYYGSNYRYDYDAKAHAAKAAFAR